MVVCACSPSYSGGWGRRIAWTQEAEVAVSRDCAIALQPGLQQWNSSSRKKTNERVGWGGGGTENKSKAANLKSWSWPLISQVLTLLLAFSLFLITQSFISGIWPSLYKAQNSQWYYFTKMLKTDPPKSHPTLLRSACFKGFQTSLIFQMMSFFIWRCQSRSGSKWAQKPVQSTLIRQEILTISFLEPQIQPP